MFIAACNIIYSADRTIVEEVQFLFELYLEDFVIAMNTLNHEYTWLNIIADRTIVEEVQFLFELYLEDFVIAMNTLNHEHTWLNIICPLNR